MNVNDRQLAFLVYFGLVSVVAIAGVICGALVWLCFWFSTLLGFWAIATIAVGLVEGWRQH